ncbi:hypothetical protein V2J09_018749 [Rumex salicifolius]
MSNHGSSPGTAGPPTPETSSWDCMLPGPPSRSNGGAADVSPAGLLAYASGSSVSVVDSRSMQLVTVIPMPPPSSDAHSLSPFVTSVRWAPITLRHTDILSIESSSRHLWLAAGDRQGRICVLDVRSRSPFMWYDSDPTSRLGIQDMCWIQTGIDTWVLAAISGPSIFSLYSATSGRCFFRIDYSPEFLSCTRRDPFDARSLVILGLKGFLLSVKVSGDRKEDVVLQELMIRTDSSELTKLEKDVGGTSTTTPASAVFPTYMAKCAFSKLWRHILFVTFPRELVVYDLQYETALFRVALPRGGKFTDVLPDPNGELLYCVHLDGRVSTWKRKEGEQTFFMCAIQEIMPSIGNSVPSPCILATLICQSDCTLQGVGKFSPGGPLSPFIEEDFDSHFDFSDAPIPVSKTHLISVSDDGKIWNWLLSSEDLEDTTKSTGISDAKSFSALHKIPENDAFNGETAVVKQPEHVKRRTRSTSLSTMQDDFLFKITLIGQLHLLSSNVTMLAVPSPSLTATLARGGNHPAAAVPLVALGTQSGTIEVVDVSANSIAACFSVHSSPVRGLRWLGNSRLVSFSYNQASEKVGGYVNKLVVTCVRSGLNRPFRVMQKPERAPVRALRASSSGRYLLILFRDAPVEVWAMTKNPIMLRSLALPFTVLEWTLPSVPRPTVPVRQISVSLKDRIVGAVSEATSPKLALPPSEPKLGTSDGSQEEASESFAFALVNGALGVFEVQGRRVKDFRPKWPSTSFNSSDGLVTAMAYRLPHVVMGDRSGNLRWWDVTTGQSSSFNTHRDGIRRIKFSPVVVGDRSRGRIAVLFYDNTFAIYDLDSADPLANSLLQPRYPGTLVLELDWLTLRFDKNDPLVLCLAGADSSFRLVEVNINDRRVSYGPTGPIKERFRPMPLCVPMLLPTPHALALRMILQLGIKPSWFNTSGSSIDRRPQQIPGVSEDLRNYIIDIPPVGDPAVPELLLKVLEPYRKDGCILDDERARLYAKVVHQGLALRLAYAAIVFGEPSEAIFWLNLPRAVNHLVHKALNKSPQKAPAPRSLPEIDHAVVTKSKLKALPGASNKETLSPGQYRSMAFEQEELWETANERILWHEKLEGDDAIQNRIHDLVTVGNLEAAVSLLLSTPPESSYFFVNALRAVALASAVSASLHELAVKVVAANMVRTDKSLSGVHLLCGVGKFQEACSQASFIFFLTIRLFEQGVLQDAGCWTDAATLAATHLTGPQYSRVLQRWADHVLYNEHDIWSQLEAVLKYTHSKGTGKELMLRAYWKSERMALTLYTAAGALPEALAALRLAHQPDTAALFVAACREIHADIMAKSGDGEEGSAGSSAPEKLGKLPGLSPESEEVSTVGELLGQYQRKLVHLCMDSVPYTE